MAGSAGAPEAGDTAITRGSSQITLTNSMPLLGTLIITNTATLTFNNWGTTLSTSNV